MVAATKLELILAGLILVGGGYFYHTWLTEHDARIRAESDVKAQHEKAEATAEGDKKQQSAMLAQVQVLATAAAQQKTPQQIVKYMPSQFPPGIAIQGSIAPATKETPTPPAIFSVPQQDLPAMNAFMAGCNECQLELASARKTIDAKSSELTASQNQVKDLQRELKGGSFWHRVGHDAKEAAIILPIGILLGIAAVKK